MRTTTKRGLGRSATLNGNGHAVLPPAVLEPLQTPEPMRRYTQPPPPPRSRWKLAGAIFGWILIALLVVASGLAGGVYLYGHETLGALAAHSKQAKATAKDKNLGKVASPTQPATALIIGYDTRQGADAAAGQSSRSDTIMLVRADPTNKTMSLMSFPRDLQTAIYCNGSNVPRTNDRINSAWSTCGEQGTLDTVAHLTNVPINYVITVDFHGFKLLVNKLHGVFIDVDRRYYIPPNTGVSQIDLQPGYQKLDGQQALDYVRYRHTDSDIYRNARQQLFLDALKDRLATSLSLTQIPSLIGAIKQSVEIAQAGGGAPNLDVIQAYVGLMYGLPAGHMFRTEIPNLAECGYLNAQVCASQSDVDQAVNTFMHPDVTVSQRANDQTLGIKATRKPVKAMQPADISTLVLNGSTQIGLARDTSYRLLQAGFKTMQLPPTLTANAPQSLSGQYDSYVYYDPVQAQSKDAATTLSKWLGANVKVAPFPAEIATDAQAAGNPLTVLVLGTSSSGTVTDPQAAIQAPPPKQPAQVSSFDPLPTYQGAGVHLSFPVMLPRVLASGSNYTSMEPVRAFAPSKGNQELALTFVTGAQNVYYQVIETNWTSAPILRNPTDKLVDKKTGRRLDLFTTSGKIHMIVFHKGGATYWVVNTLRDELSNDTMLAIARGLQPVSH